MPLWDTQKEQQLRELAAGQDRPTNNELAAQFGVSKNAISGKLKRMRLKLSDEERHRRYRNFKKKMAMRSRRR